MIYRSADIPTRQRYVRLVESVKENGGTVRIFSSLHISGEREYEGDGGEGRERERERERVERGKRRVRERFMYYMPTLSQN